ncbi:OsmC family protein [Denitromonas halophila]|uniref:OsmC family protein n=1 Tax=Denitromonas halophila TaxID=1629404 RepID=A0A557R082_9RHOO|nr:OsmC family protein [Denitromonas halophila]TVO58526.1 OsmC family protein [Denitromonas halophila]
MGLQDIEAAICRAKAAFQRRPKVGISDDAPASARWVAGTRVLIRNANGIEVATDMPAELGGSGDQVSPGWLFRAGIASCATTSIVMAAACEGIVLTKIEVDVGSRSDARGLLGMSESNGAPVSAGPFDVELRVTVAANGSTPAALKTLVESCLSHSPVPSALLTATPFSLHVTVAS